MTVLREFVTNRGVAMPLESRHLRRPRSCFFSAERPTTTSVDAIWDFTNGGCLRSACCRCGSTPKTVACFFLGSNFGPWRSFRCVCGTPTWWANGEGNELCQDEFQAANVTLITAVFRDSRDVPLPFSMEFSMTIHIWGFPKMVVPCGTPKTPQNGHFSGKTNSCWVPPF